MARVPQTSSKEHPLVCRTLAPTSPFGTRESFVVAVPANLGTVNPEFVYRTPVVSLRRTWFPTDSGKGTC